MGPDGNKFLSHPTHALRHKLIKSSEEARPQESTAPKVVKNLCVYAHHFMLPSFCS